MLSSRGNDGRCFGIAALHFAYDAGDSVGQVVAAWGEVQEEAADLAD
jgi:hypothetical protein